LSSADEKPLPGAKSDHVMKFYLDDDGRREIPAEKLIPRPKHEAHP
jgi:hypothetical protein